MSWVLPVPVTVALGDQVLFVTSTCESESPADGVTVGVWVGVIVCVGVTVCVGVGVAVGAPCAAAGSAASRPAVSSAIPSTSGPRARYDTLDAIINIGESPVDEGRPYRPEGRPYTQDSTRGAFPSGALR